MTVDELRAIIEQESGFKLNKLMTTTGRIAKDASELYVKDPVGYQGIAKISGAPVKMLWEVQKRGEDWYYSATPLD